jgi:tetratricopeptide (TPR) repeat protein
MNRRLILGALVVVAGFAVWYCVHQLRERAFKDELSDALVAYASKDYPAAEQMLTALLAKVEHWWPNGPEEAETLSWLGIVHQVQDRNDLAVPEFRRAIALAEQLGTPLTIPVGRAKLGLGIIARDDADYDQAEKLFSEAAQILTKDPKEACGDDGGALLNLGYLADKRGKYQEAESYLLQAESAYENYDHTTPTRDFGKTHFQLAEVYRHTHRFDVAAKQYQAALQMFLQVEGPRSRDAEYAAVGLAIVQGSLKGGPRGGDAALVSAR